MLCTMEYGVFFFFAFMVLMMTLFVIILLPETKNKDLENTYRLFQQHWFWTRLTNVKALHRIDLPMGANIKLAASDDSDSGHPKLLAT